MSYYIKCLKEYAVFRGRARRSEYWYFVLFSIIFAFIFGLIERVLCVERISDIYVLASIVPGIAVGVRRMHDVGKSGWFLLIPIYNIVLAVTEGFRGENEYGPDPKMSS